MLFKFKKLNNIKKLITLTYNYFNKNITKILNI